VPWNPHGLKRYLLSTTALGPNRPSEKGRSSNSQSQGDHQGAPGPGMTLRPSWVRVPPPGGFAATIARDDNTIRQSKFRPAGALNLSEDPEPDGFPLV
jgi:hypothetical protein